MGRRPASITQAEITRAIKAARQAGAAEIEIKLGGASVIVRLLTTTDSVQPADSSEPEIVL